MLCFTLPRNLAFAITLMLLTKQTSLSVELIAAPLTNSAAALLVAPRVSVVAVTLERAEAIECVVTHFTLRRVTLVVFDNVFGHTAFPIFLFATLVRAGDVVSCGD